MPSFINTARPKLKWAIIILHFVLFYFILNYFMHKPTVTYESHIANTEKPQKQVQFNSSIRQAIRMEPIHANPHEFRYLINPKETICGDKRPVLLALVISAPGNFERRDLIRRTWASKKFFYMKAVFLMGFDYSNSTVNKQLVDESREFKDIIQESFHDTYENLTFKTVMAFKWSAKYCPEAQVFIKVDDDVYLNTHKLESFLVDINVTGANRKEMRNTFMCNVNKNAPVNRDLANKWHLTVEEYPFDSLVTYCGGPAYMFTSDLSQKLYDQSLKTKKVRLEDIYVGKLAAILDSRFLPLKLEGNYLFVHGASNFLMEWLFLTYELCLRKEYEIYMRDYCNKLSKSKSFFI